MVRLLLATLCVTAFAYLAPEANAQTQPLPCQDILPRATPAHPSVRPVAPVDLARLRDIGVPDIYFPGSGVVALSPDRARAAFQLRQAIAETNSYCLAMVVLDLSRPGPPRIIDSGGELIRYSFDFRGKAAFPTGVALPIAPRWSPDGRWVAFLKRVGGRTQVWRADASGGGSAPLSRIDTDVEDFRITSDGHSLLLVTRPGLQEARARIEREALSGFHYDDRYSPIAGDRPFPPTPVNQVYLVQDLATGNVREAEPAEIAHINPTPSGAPSATAMDRSPSGRATWIEPDTTSAWTLGLKAEIAPGQVIACAAPACRGELSNPSWSPNGAVVRYFRREGWGRGGTGVYEWSPQSGHVRRLYETEEVLAECQPRGATFLCLHEAATQPRRLVDFDPKARTIRSVFDPNPEFKTLQMGHVERLRVRNSFGIESYSDLVLPIGYQPGRRYPLIVVQYESRGFLRGGTGDEYPVHAFASRGFAVLSVNRPRSVGRQSGATDPIELDRLNLANDFADRRSVHEGTMLALQQVIDRGIADPARLGISGLSDGTSSLQYALLNTNVFAAAASSSGSFEPNYNGFVGPAAAREFRAMGYPAILDPAPKFWSRISLTRGAQRMRTPLLWQVDDEYVTAVTPLTALREAGTPVDLYIFPDEHHIKWQPAHRLAIYRRSIQWFDYWLNGIEQSDPVDPDQYGRWREMHAAVGSGQAADPQMVPAGR